MADIIIVDFREPLKTIQNFNLHLIFRLFPIKEIIEYILSKNCYAINANEGLWLELDNRLEAKIKDNTIHKDFYSRLSVDTMSLVFETIEGLVDEYLQHKLQSNIDYCDYKFNKWIEPDSLILLKS